MEHTYLSNPWCEFLHNHNGHFAHFRHISLEKKGILLSSPYSSYILVWVSEMFFFFFTANLYRHTTYKLQIICVVCLYIRYCPRLSNQVEHQTTSAYFENKHFFALSLSYLPKLWTTSSKFVLSKSSFGIKNQTKFSVKNIWVGLNTTLDNITTLQHSNVVML